MNCFFPSSSRSFFVVEISFETENGELFTWGNGACGALGHGDEKDVLEPKKVSELSDVKVLQVKCGANHMAVLAEGVGIYTWGNNFLGPLGRILGKGKDSDYSPRPIDLVQTGATVSEENLKGSDEIVFKQVECLKYNTLALSGRHLFLYVGVSPNSKQGIKLKIKYFKTDNGEVFSCGKGGFDGGGHGDSPHTLFCLVETLKGSKITQIASCMSSHTAALSHSGEVYIWGNGEYGSLGFGDLQSRSYPTKLTLVFLKKLKK